MYKKLILLTLIFIVLSSFIVNSQEKNRITEITGENNLKIGIKVSQIGWENGSDTVVILNEKSTIDGIVAAPLANLYNAPILLVNKDSIPKELNDELKRLNPKNIIIIGGNDNISTKVEIELKNILSNIEIERISGQDRYDTSLLIAKKMSESKDIKRVYIGSGEGEPDLISIVSKAAEEKVPILLTKKDFIDEDIYKWIYSKKLEDAYIIGGKEKISDTVIDTLNKVTKHNISKNRIYGKDRFETNAMVIKKFYENQSMDNLIIVDANDTSIASQVAPLSAKLGCPIFLFSKTKLSEVQKSVLDDRNISHIYKLGNSVDKNVFNEISEMLFLKNIDYSNKEVLFFIPHQDDEILSFSNTIKKYLDSNSRVRVVLMTNGSMSYSRKLLNGENNIFCSIHNYVHNPTKEEYTIENNLIEYINKDDFTKYRDDEFKRCLLTLGVKEEDIYFYENRVDDGKLNRAVAINGINEFIKKYPNSRVHTFYDGAYSKNNHIDHIALGQGAKRLYESGVIKELYMHIEPYLYNDLVKNGLSDEVYKYESFNENQTKNILKALKEYCKWDPKNGKLAIGYHSVKSYFDDALKNPVNYIMKLE